MLLTPATLQSLQTQFSRIFEGARGKTAQDWQRFAMRVPSSTSVNTYGWMQPLFEMREWIGPRVIENLQATAYTLVNKSYEKTIGVDRDEIEDDNLGIYTPLMAELGRVIGRLPYQLSLEAVEAGSAAASLGFDGVPFFDASHPLDPAGVQSNETDTPFTAAGWTTVRTAMRELTGENGLPLGIDPDLVMIPPSHETQAKTIFNAERSSNGATNVQAMNGGEAKYLVIPEWTAANGWYAVDTKTNMKPIIYQDRRSAVLTSRTQLNDDNVFFQKKFIWGADARSVAGYGPWWLMHKSTSTDLVDP